jgi:hypothetical protein
MYPVVLNHACKCAGGPGPFSPLGPAPVAEPSPLDSAGWAAGPPDDTLTPRQSKTGDEPHTHTHTTHTLPTPAHSATGKVAVLEGIEDFLQLGEGAHAPAGSGAAGSRRFSFDLTGIDMQALEQLTSPGPSSRRGSISLSFLEAEGIMVPKLLAGPVATTSTTTTTRAATAAPAAPMVVIKAEPPVSSSEDESSASTVTATMARADSTSSVTSAGSSGSGSTGTSTKRKAPAGGQGQAGAGTKRKLAAVATVAIKKEEAAEDEEEETAPSSPTLTAAAMMLPCTPQTPHHKPSTTSSSSTPSTAAAIGNISPNARGASAATTAAMATLAAASSASGSGSGSGSGSSGTGGPSYALPVIPDDGLKRVGIYTVEERKARVARFQAKRHLRVWKKAVKYACRKNLADNRPRVKGACVGPAWLGARVGFGSV